ncbi:protein-S-isoprenylcysteine O-methyltransferase [Brucella tritici]|uniref:Isoprenylcysteine carboxylmethyltransferase family protein n=1 Tax=Brucella tritici TaxID=94626 RepID=A0A6L3YUX1_9HYPH|nr:protein-S-isoprenylcysteine O-methyltransferase [Brucella tritici]KAB2688316.1 isoprenylcysteine carboxylmethyltransferase family protein [Brucella tritici]
MTPTLAAIVWAMGLVAWVVIRIPHQRRARKIKVANNAKTLADRLALGAASVGLSLIPIVYVATGFPALADYAFQPWLAWIGLIVETAFLWLFYASHRQLGKNWSVSLEIRREHNLVTDGLYKYVRHPMYLSFWLWAIAQFCLLPNWFAGLAGLAGVAILYFYRVDHEEAMMRTAFGASYDEYAHRTGRVIPRIKF